MPPAGKEIGHAAAVDPGAGKTGPAQERFEKAERAAADGAAHTINYKTEDLRTAIRAACPDGIDIFFDNVGGEILCNVW